MQEDEREKATPTEEPVRFLVWRVVGWAFGLPLEQMRKIGSAGEVTRVPGSWPWVKGVLAFRGQIVPLFDMRVRLGLPQEADPDGSGRILLVSIRDKWIALTADEIVGIQRVEPAAIEPAERFTIAGVERRFLAGAIRQGGELTLVPDLDKMFLTAEHSLDFTPDGS